MSTHLIVGSGGIGRATAQALVARGHEVVVASRTGAPIDGLATLAVDATDADALTAAAHGMASIINAVNPKSYQHWDKDWPPIAHALLAAAERTGAGLVTISNLYAYGQVDAPMTESTPLRPNGIKGQVRATMWTDALALHTSGRIRATELRASDYFGPSARAQVSFLNQYVIKPAAQGKTVSLVMGTPDATHTWTYLDDIGTLAATLATDERGWGEAWHVPSAPARSMREVATEVAAYKGVPTPKVKAMPAALKGALRVMPLIRGLDETKHQFERPFVLDATKAETTFGLQATPWDQALYATVDAL